MKRTIVYMIVAVAVIAAAAGLYFGISQPQAGGLPSPDFTGRIVGGNTSQHDYTGAAVLTDEGCTIDPRTGLSNCTAQLQTSAGVISFNYEHDMMEKPCLSAGDRADLHVQAGSAAEVKRTYWAGGGA